MKRRALTMVELLVAMTILSMVVLALTGLAQTSEQGFQYCQGYGGATQHARVVNDRIRMAVEQAHVSRSFAGCLVVTETAGGYTYPDTLAVWSAKTPSDPAGLPKWNEITLYSPDPLRPYRLLEWTFPEETGTTPAFSDQSGWIAALRGLRNSTRAKKSVLTSLLRQGALSSGSSTNRGMIRFVQRILPSDSALASQAGGTVLWSNLPWAQGNYCTKSGMRQIWIRWEMQLLPDSMGGSSSLANQKPVPFFGSAALYTPCAHP